MTTNTRLGILENDPALFQIHNVLEELYETNLTETPNGQLADYRLQTLNTRTQLEIHDLLEELYETNLTETPNGQLADYRLQTLNTRTQSLFSGVNVGELELNNTRTFSGVVSIANVSENFRFQMQSAGNFHARLTGLNEDDVVRFSLIRDANNNGIADDQDILSSSVVANSDGAIHISSLAGGTYFLQVRKTSSDPGIVTHYNLRLSNTGAMPISNLLNGVDHDVSAHLSREDLTEITSKTNRGYVLDRNHAILSTSFVLKEASNFSAVLSDIPEGGNVDLFLLRDHNGNGLFDSGDYIAGSSKPGNSDEAINVRMLEAGTYQLQTVYNSSSTAEKIIPKLRIATTRFTPSNLLARENDLGLLRNSNGIMPNKVAHRGYLTDHNTEDTVRFRVTGNQRVNLSLTGLTANADLRLIQDRNQDGRASLDELIQMSTRRGSTSESITRLLTAGEYIVQVYMPESGHTGYKLDVTALGA